MESIMKSEFFFVVTTGAVVFITIGLIIIFYYIIRILRDVAFFSKSAKNSFKNIEEAIINNPFFKFFKKKSRSTSSHKK